MRRSEYDWKHVGCDENEHDNLPLLKLIKHIVQREARCHADIIRLAWNVKYLLLEYSAVTYLSTATARWFGQSTMLLSQMHDEVRPMLRWSSGLNHEVQVLHKCFHVDILSLQRRWNQKSSEGCEIGATSDDSVSYTFQLIHHWPWSWTYTCSQNEEPFRLTSKTSSLAYRRCIEEPCFHD